MAQDLITKRIRSSTQSMMIAKIRLFFKRSVFMYLAASILLGLAVPSLFGGIVSTILGCFGIICIISFSGMYLSSRIQKKKFDANMTFSQDAIKIEHLNKALTENKEWSWILRAQESPNAFILTISKVPGYEVFLQKKSFTENELNTFRSMIESKL